MAVRGGLEGPEARLTVAKRSAALLLYRRRGGELEVLIAHPGGPLWAKRDAGAWSVPKGEIERGEEPLAVARREFEEETGQRAPDGNVVPLGEVRQKSGKLVEAWAVEGDLDPATARSNTFPLEWPPGSGNWMRMRRCFCNAGSQTSHSARRSRTRPAEACCQNWLRQQSLPSQSGCIRSCNVRRIASPWALLETASECSLPSGPV